MRRPPTLALIAALVLGLAACGDEGDDDGGERAGASTTTIETTTSTGSEPEGADTTGPTTSDPGETTTTEGELPGEPIDIFPYEGAELAVIGVAADDTLNVRSGPGTGFEVVAELDPLSQGSTATGSNRTVGDSIWVELEVEGTTGWANGAYLAQAGAVTDVTADLPAGIAGETMVEVGQAVAAARAPQGEGPTPTVTVVDGPTVGDLGEVTVDVVGLADDAQKGERLHVFAAPDPSGEGFVLRTVEATALCARGVTAEGLCT